MPEVQPDGARLLAELESRLAGADTAGVPRLCFDLVGVGESAASKGDYRSGIRYVEAAVNGFARLREGLSALDTGHYARALGVLGSLRADTGNLPEGHDTLQASLAVYAELDPLEPTLWDGHRAQTLSGLARVHARQGAFDEGLRYARQAVKAASATGRAGSERITVIRGAALVLEAKLLRELARPEEALTALERAASAFTAMMTNAPAAARELADLAAAPGTEVRTACPELGSLLLNIALNRAAAGQVEGALRYATGAADLVLPSEDGSVKLVAVSALSAKANLLDQIGDPSAAVPVARRSVELAEECLSEEVPGSAAALWGCIFNLGVDLLHAGRRDEAREVAAGALPRIDPHQADQAAWIDSLRGLADHSA
jgi:tetratricopeptide (TPR) repeat protein